MTVAFRYKCKPDKGMILISGILEKNHFQAGFGILALRSRKITMVLSGMQ